MSDTKPPYPVGGYKPSKPDSRDLRLFHFGASPSTQAALPAAFEAARLRDVPMTDQEWSPECVGFSTTVRMQLAILIATGQLVELSPTYVYGHRKAAEGDYMDEGMEPRDALKHALKEGVLTEATWLANHEPSLDYAADAEQRVAALPGATVSEASRFRIAGYAALNGVGEIKRALVEHGPVLVGANLSDAFFAAKGDTVIPAGNYKPDTGHCFTIGGYDDAKGAWLVRNTWGEAWGDKGYAWLSYDFAFGEAWAVTGRAPLDTLTLKLTVGHTAATINDAPITLAAPPLLESNRVYVALTDAAEYLLGGRNAQWDGGTETATFVVKAR